MADINNTGKYPIAATELVQTNTAIFKSPCYPSKTTL